MNIEPGIYLDLSNEQYHGHHSSYSKSSLSSVGQYPYKLIWDRTHPKKKEVFDVGTAAHTAILELEKWEKSVVVIPSGILAKNGAKSTNAYKSWAADQDKNKALITEAQRDKVMRVYESIHTNPYHSEARSYLTGGKAEISAFWVEIFKGDEIDDETGYHYMSSHQYGDPEGCHSLMIKCRPDYYPQNGVIVDLKTTAVDVSDIEALVRHAYKLKYHWSAALSCRGMTTATGKPHREYIFVFVQLNPKVEVAPAVRVLRATQDFIALGKLEIMKTMQTLAYCDLYDKWPWLPNKVEQMSLPGYIHKKLIYEKSQFEF